MPRRRTASATILGAIARIRQSEVRIDVTVVEVEKDLSVQHHRGGALKLSGVGEDVGVSREAAQECSPGRKPWVDLPRYAALRLATIVVINDSNVISEMIPSEITQYTHHTPRTSFSMCAR